MDQFDEITLIKSSQEGDDFSFEKLINIYEKKIYNIALRLMKSHDDAMDMAQESIIKIYKSIKSFKGNSTFSVWIYRITVNTCFDALRKRKKQNTISLDIITEELGMQFEDKALTPENEFEQKQTLKEIEMAINSLNDEYRIIITLCDIYGMSYKDIAKITNTNIGTVKSRINRARLLLQKKLKANSTKKI